MLLSEVQGPNHILWKASYFEKSVGRPSVQFWFALVRLCKYNTWDTICATYFNDLYGKCNHSKTVTQSLREYHLWLICSATGCQYCLIFDKLTLFFMSWKTSKLNWCSYIKIFWEVEYINAFFEFLKIRTNLEIGCQKASSQQLQIIRIILFNKRIRSIMKWDNCRVMSQ